MSTVVLMKKELMLNGLTCAHCASVIDEKVKHIDGVKNSNLNFTNKKLSVEIDCDNEDIKIYWYGYSSHYYECKFRCLQR